ncbi:ribonuclease H-like domain-containing protein [Tanacetum coccineum]
MFLSQQKYATKVLDRAGMLNCKPCRTPVDTNSKLSADGAPISDSTLYRSLAGALQYLTFTRPDISYAVQQVCLFMHDPREPHLSALKRILWYVRGTLSYGLQLYSSTMSSLVAYSDADWAGCPTTCRSTSGYCVFLGNNILSWSSKRQFTLSRSSVKAKYRGVANAVAETCWLRNLLRELHTPLATATLVYCDNVWVVAAFWRGMNETTIRPPAAITSAKVAADLGRVLITGIAITIVAVVLNPWLGCSKKHLWYVGRRSIDVVLHVKVVAVPFEKSFSTKVRAEGGGGVFEFVMAE